MSGPKAKAGVVVSKDGPYVVTGNVPLETQTIAADADGGSELWKQGQPIEAREKYSLCRCGQSKNPPFCDGTHAKVGFDGTETASRESYVDQAEVLDGPTMALMDAEQLCAFGRFCDPHGKVWNQVERTDDPHVLAMFIRQVGNCPAGRLVAWDKATGKAVEPLLPVSIGLVEDPPEGSADRSGYEAELPSFRRMALNTKYATALRCADAGSSKNKPFCDGTHASIKFHAT